MDVGLKIHNRFDFVLKRDGKVIQTAKAENVVLNRLFSCYNGLVGAGNASYNGQYILLTLGTGTSTPSVTDTQMSNAIYTSEIDSISYQTEANNLTVMTVHETVSESSAIGLLSEVGLWGCGSGNANTSYGCLVTRALITDSEDNPITINKTVADILEITATVYFTVNVPSPYKLIRGYCRYADCKTTDSSLWGTDLEADCTTTDAMPSDGPDYGLRCLTRFRPVGNFHASASSSSTAYVYELFGVTRPVRPWSGSGNIGMRLFTLGTNNGAANNELMRCTSDSVASTDQNRDVTYLIKSIILPGGFLLQFPNSSIYPPKQLTLTLVGDGATTDFDFPVPELSTSNVSVSINGAVQDPSTYTFGGKNFAMQQAWCSCDTRYLKKTGYVFLEDATSGTGTRVDTGFFNLEYPAKYEHAYIWGSTHPATLNPRVYDFEAPKTVNTFKNTVTTSAPSANTVDLEYSTDGETWTQAASISARNADSATFSPISARYWRIIGIPTTNSGDSKSITDADVLFGFDNVQPGIHFNTAPALNDNIEVTCYCEYPMKNENWRIDSIVSDIKYTRSVNP